MDTIRNRRASPSERFLGLLSSSPTSPTASGVGELDEGELFSAGFASSPPPPSPAAASPPSAASSIRITDEPSGILAALPAGRRAALLRNPLLSATPSRAVPKAPRAAEHFSLSLPSAGRAHRQQSAPVAVPAAARRGRFARDAKDEIDEEGVEDDDEEAGAVLLPPHEIVARASSPLTASSVLEGRGRTLKGRDLRRVRNAVWRQTGFLD